MLGLLHPFLLGATNEPTALGTCAVRTPEQGPGLDLLILGRVSFLIPVIQCSVMHTRAMKYTEKRRIFRSMPCSHSGTSLPQSHQIVGGTTPAHGRQTGAVYLGKLILVHVNALSGGRGCGLCGLNNTTSLSQEQLFARDGSFRMARWARSVVMCSERNRFLRTGSHMHTC